MSRPLIDDLLQKGLGLHQAGDTRSAAELYRQVLAADADQPAANHLLGLVRLQAGEADEAVVLLTRAVKANPGDAQYLGNLGVALNAAGQHDKAIAAFERAIAHRPDFAEAYSNKGMALRAQRRFEEAAAAYREAVRLRPNEAGFHFNLANALRDAGYLFDAESSYRRAVHLRPRYGAAINGLAAMLDGQGRSTEAIELVDAALKDLPDDPQLHLRRARALCHFNRLDDAVASFDRAIALRPGFGEAHLQRAYIIRQAARDRHVEAMEQLFRNDAAPVEDRIFAGFGLGKALTDLGEHPAAIAAFTEANRLNRQRVSFSLERAEAQLRADVARFDGIEGPLRDGGFREAMPIFVVGLPRAGKTTVETILGNHPAVAGAGELPTLNRLVNELLAEIGDRPVSEVPPDRFTELGRSYMREAQSLIPAGMQLVDTMPSNYRHIGFIRLAMPYARIIHCVRDTADHCIAIYEKYFTNLGYEYSNDIDELQAFHAAYRGHVEGWRTRFPGDIYDINLVEMLSDRQGQVRRLLEYCGLGWNPACLADARSEPQLNDWPRDRLIENRRAHLAAWREVRPHLWAETAAAVPVGTS